MRRRQLLEIHEQPWCPAAVRDGATDYLAFLATVGNQYRGVVPVLRRALARSGATTCVDLGSGAGGPWPRLAPALNEGAPTPTRVILTDLHPHGRVFRRAAGTGAGSVVAWPAPVDLRHPPAELTGFRTLFTSFHHFPPPDARAILQDAVERGEGIGIFEQTARRPLALAMMIALVALPFVALPFVRPFRWSRLLWTLVPVIPLVLTWDGIVSCLRTYTPDELRAMVDSLRAPDGTGVYTWEIGRVASPWSPIGVLYTVGYPVRD